MPDAVSAIFLQFKLIYIRPCVSITVPTAPIMAKRTVRIIGGKWKGRKLEVIQRPGLRPTMDRVRETLFNWLGTDVEGARVLDLFAGTGALAFEALSRGAASATLVERDLRTANLLRGQAQRLDAACEIRNVSALPWLRRQSTWNWNIVFVDPPFEPPHPTHRGRASKPRTVAAEVLALLRQRETTVYVETRSVMEAPGWTTIKQSRAGDCRFRLLRPEH